MFYVLKNTLTTLDSTINIVGRGYLTTWWAKRIFIWTMNEKIYIDELWNHEAYGYKHDLDLLM